MAQKRQLLCTFATNTNYKQILQDIRRFYTTLDGSFFILYNTKLPSELFITYNVLLVGGEKIKFQSTISIHRKKHTNTLYTLNAMNRIIRDENAGVFDDKFQINWELFTDSLLLTTDLYIKVVPIKIYTIIS